MSSKQEREEQIAEMCTLAGCKDKIRKIHFDQYVHRNWHPHPPKEFRDWWTIQPEFTQGIDSKRAYNCDIYRQRYLEAKEIGVL